jgi:uncharacterized protein
MLYRRFGRTELQMPVFSCGGMRYQYKWQDVSYSDIPADQQANLEATINRAVEVGINHIETARGYGSSEMQLGKILSKFPREKLIVQTKIAPVADATEFRKTFEQSLSYLQLDYVDLLGLHGINTAELLDYSVRPGGCLDVVRQLQTEGKVRFVGFSTHGSTDVIIQAINTNKFDYVNLHWYYINQWNWPAIEAATRHDMGVFIISPTDKGGQLYNPPKKLVDLCAPLSPMVFNDLFCLSHAQVHTLSLGAAKPQDFDEHLQTLDLINRGSEILTPILTRLEDVAITSLGEDWIKTWETNLPQWEQTPGQVNIRVILWLLNLATAYDLVDYADKLNEIDLQQCLRDSPHADKIPQFLAKAHQLLAGEELQRLSQT